jgi:GntR family transcriptional repressor for pyruvate dehydrogenase complex
LFLGIKKLQQKKAWEEVADQIQKLIISGEWQLGDRLPSEIELASQFGVSRPTLREALRQLNLFGLIDIRHGEGNFISHPEAGSFMLPLLPLLVKNKDNVLAIMEGRSMIEVKTASLAAARASDNDIETLGNYLQQMIALDNNDNDNNKKKEQFAKTDHLFHKQIALATKNPIIIKMYQAIEELLLGQQFQIIWFSNARKSGIVEHQKIFDAIKGRDVQGAGVTMLEHMESTLERILANLKKD